MQTNLSPIVFRWFLYVGCVLFLHVLVMKSIAKLQKRLQVFTDEKIKLSFRSLRFQLYALWFGWVMGIFAKLWGMEPFFLATKAMTSFLFCFLLGEILLWVAFFWGRRWFSTERSLESMHKGIRFVFGAIGVLTAINNLGYSLSGLLATLGVGGMALAFAAQKTLADVWAALSLVLDHPFQEGDWIILPKVGVAGKVISIGLRSTRLHTQQGTFLSIPNSMLAAECIENQGRKG